jgi:sensor histidine kinase regulating citrate/malate metabolism
MKVEFVLVMRRLRRFTLAGQLLVAQLVILLAILGAVAFLSLAESEASFTRTEGRRVFAIAEQLASTPVVRQELAPPQVINALPTVVQGAVTQYGLSLVSVADEAGVVKASSDPTTEGDLLPLGSPSVRQGASWTGALELGERRMLVAQTPVLYSPDENADPDEPPVGTRLGTVMVAVEMPSVIDRLKGASSYLLTYLGLALALGVIGSWLVARRIKRQTLGLEPREIAGLAESREATLSGLAEGVVALDTHNRITLVNNIAQQLLDLPEHAVGMAVTDLSIGPRLREVLLGQTDPSEKDQVVLRRGKVLVMNRMEVSKDGRAIGSVTTLRDRTELATLERELGSFRSTTELLRAQAHEFANQLHTISGLIQLEDYDEVVRYVDSVSADRAQLDLTLARRLRDPAVAALVLAKAAQAKERRVELRISDDTSLERLGPAASADLAAVVGNLVDNAIDAAATAGGPEMWVELSVRQDATTVEVVVTDSGPGVAPELATEVFTHGFTTKAAEAGERGIGLGLTRLICQRRGGEVDIENAPEGARFIARLTVEPAPAQPEEVR